MGTGSFGSKPYKDEFLFRTEYVFNADCEKIQEDLLAMCPIIHEFFDLIKKVDERYKGLKKSINVIDFSDFEHLALAILRNDNVRDYYRGRYKEIYVDEYQDTSKIQEEIIRLVTSDNLFMVGDVKQSIYRFRHAKPQIFINKMNLFLDYEKENHISNKNGTLLKLNKNFRSLPCVLDAVNDVFSQIMTLEAGEVDYEDGHELFYDNLKQTSSERVGVLLTDVETKVEEQEQDDEQEENVEMSSYGKEACTVAGEIATLMEEGVFPGDIAILARTRNICAEFFNVLESVGIPAIRDKGEDTPDIYELRVLEDMLAVLDNPKQDIPLVGVMRSPIFGNGFNEDELLTIRTNTDKDKSYFHECCQDYLENGKDKKLKAKLIQFFDLIATYRNMTQFMNPGDVLSKILRNTQLVLYASSMPDGKRRVSYLNRFVDWVRSFCSSRRCGAHEAVKYLEELNEKSSGERPFAVEESTSDSVKIMTIHRSKGLEYKVVFLVGMSSRIRASSGSDNINISDDGLLGIWFIDSEKGYKYPTPTVYAVTESKRKAELAEEMRLLYVAMTRAKEKLYLSGTYKLAACIEEGKGINKTALRAKKSLSPQLVLSAGSMLDWIIMSLARNPYADLSSIGIQKEKNSSEITNSSYFKGWDIKSYNGENFESNLLDIEQRIKKISIKEDIDMPNLLEDIKNPFDEDLYFKLIKEKFFSKYKFEGAANKPLKFSVGQIKKKAQYLDDEDLMLPSADKTSKGMNLKVNSPSDYIISDITPQRKGVIVHGFLRYADITILTPDCTKQKVLSHIDKMHEFEMFTAEEVKILYTYADLFTQYFNSSLALRMVSAGDNLFKEAPFTLALPCNRFCNEEGFGKKDSILVQGIIDCWFLEDERAVIVDYKTDRISGNDDYIRNELIRRYGLQLSMYSLAILRIKGVQIKEAVIWHIPKGKEYKIPIDENIKKHGTIF